MEGIKIDGKSAAIGACVGGLLGGVLVFVACRRSFNERLDHEIAAVKHHYQVRAEASAAQSADSMERPVPTLADMLGQPGVSVGFADPLRNHEVSWIHPNDLVVRKAGVRDSVSNPDVEYVDDSGVERDFYGNAVDHLAAIKASEDKLKTDLAAFDPADPRLEGCDPEDEDEVVAWPPANRIRTQPYVISAAEFAEGAATGVHQCLTIKWYNEDRVLLDDQQAPIPDVRRTTGPLSKGGFGGVSGDPNIRYVRNERLEVDFEILFHEGSYTELVLNYGTANPRNRQ